MSKLNLSSVMLGSKQPKIMATFYEKVFEKPADMVQDDWHGWSVGSTYFSVGSHSEVSDKASDPKRMMFNFETSDVKEEFERIRGIEGAEVISEPYQLDKMWIATLADPDGNYFQLMTPWK